MENAKQCSYKTRPCHLVSKRLIPKLVEITANGLNVPLPDRNWNEKWCKLNEEIVPIYPKIYNFEVRADDVFVVTFPKCGTTWMQEAAWLLLNNLDYQQAQKISLPQRSIYLEFESLLKRIPPEYTIEFAEQQKSPRLLKCHLPAHLIPWQIWNKKSKIIFVARNPKDVMVSHYHFITGLGVWQGPLDEFVNDIINDEILYCPFWQYIIDFWQMRNEPNVFFTTYEQMKTNLAQVLQKLCVFLQRPALTDEQMQTLLQHLSFQNMKKNDKTNMTLDLKTNLDSTNSSLEFMRSGKIGTYKTEMSEESQRKIETWSKKALSEYNINFNDIFGEV